MRQGRGKGDYVAGDGGERGGRGDEGGELGEGGGGRRLGLRHGVCGRSGGRRCDDAEDGMCIILLQVTLKHFNGWSWRTRGHM